MADPRSVDLLRDHAAIESLSARLMALIEGDAAPAELSLALGHLVDTVSDHLSLEDAMIYTLAMRAQPGVAEDSVQRARAEFDRLKANWNDYLVEWPPEAIERDRATFVRATRAMLPRLRERVRLENELLFALGVQAPPRN